MCLFFNILLKMKIDITKFIYISKILINSYIFLIFILLLLPPTLGNPMLFRICTIA